jgi:hypothetical protein
MTLCTAMKELNLCQFGQFVSWCWVTILSNVYFQYSPSEYNQSENILKAEGQTILCSQWTEWPKHTN